MKKTEVYVDASVLGGCFEPEFAPWSNGLVDDFRAGGWREAQSLRRELEATQPGRKSQGRTAA